MNSFVAIIVPGADKAHACVVALEDLHRDGSVTVYATAVVHREEDGALALDHQESDTGPVGAALGAVLGVLFEAFRGSARSATHTDVSEDFIDDLKERFRPGDFAIISEVTEEWTAPLDTRVAQLGGTVVRESRMRYVEELFGRAVDDEKAGLEAFKTKRASARAERTESDLELGIESTAVELRGRAEKAQRRLERSKEELEAKLKRLEDQASEAKPEVKTRIQQRIAELRKDFDQRLEKLRR